MRRLATLATLAVGVLFAALALPGSPLRSRLASMLGDRPVASPAVRTAVEPAGASPLRVAIGAMISPERTYDSYADLFRLLAGRLQRPLELKQRRTYQELNGLIRRGEVDVAWICTGAWPELAESRAARLLAVPVVEGKRTYNALVLAGPAAPQAKDLAGLEGARFVFTDPISLTGCLYPKRSVAGLGREAGAFFSGTSFTGGHDRSIEAVRRGLAGGASVDSLVFHYLARRFPEEVAGVRVLETSPPFPIPPIVVPASTPDITERALRAALLGMAADEEGRKLLDALLVDGFDLAAEGDYARLR
jgi:phosphonate transport system substrate-binding protein